MYTANIIVFHDAIHGYVVCFESLDNDDTVKAQLTMGVFLLWIKKPAQSYRPDFSYILNLLNWQLALNFGKN